jgi:FKBP-type peptidyl-prolyl cis-trans isomerase
MRRLWSLVAAMGLVLGFSGGMMQADDKKEDAKKEEKKDEAKEKKEVELPKLPEGAGKVDKDAPKTFTETKSGLKYRVLRKGGDAKPKATNEVEVNYHGWLDNGKVFDSSYKRKESISFPLNRVIPGWTEGMQLVGKGGMIELEIPYKLGYGEDGSGPIPPKATLHFLVELIEIK